MKPKRKPKKLDKASKLILEEVIGLTTKDANGLASSSNSSRCVYMAGCVAVVYHVDTGKQLHLLVSHRAPKPLSCIAVSRNGRFVAAGESGYQSAVVVWDLETLASLFELKGHQHGVACMDFSHDGKYLVSVGFSQDGYLCLWEWRSGMLAAKVKASSSYPAVASVRFSSNAQYIITSGKSHLKFWKLSTNSRANSRRGLLAVHGKPINLGHHKGCSFVALSSAFSTNIKLVDRNQNGEISPLHALTDSGMLCLLNSQFRITNSVDLKVKKGFDVSASNKVVACACNNGLVKLFAIFSLKHTGSLLYSEERCKKFVVGDSDAKANESEFPDAIACKFSLSNKLVVVYRDHSLYIWDIHDESKGTKSCVLVSHSACIWDVKNLSCEYMHNPSLACVARGCPGGVSFTTCSDDGTIRLWDLTLQPELSEGCSSIAKDSLANTKSVGTNCSVSAGIFERDSVMSSFSTKGFRAMAVSSDGKHLAAGDCEGNLHLYDLCTSDYIYVQGAHNAEILSLTFSSPAKKDGSEKDLKGYCYLASGGQDHIIHLYDVDRNFDLLGSVEDHSAAVTSVLVNASGRKLLSCSADGYLLFHDVAATDTGYNISRCHKQVASHETIYDMTVDPMLEHIVTVGKDTKVNTFSIAAEELIGSFKQDGDFRDPMKISLDPSSSYMVFCYSNKLCIYDFLTGEMVTQAMGHGEAVTGVTFLPDCKHLVSVDASGCIFVWKLPAPFSSKMVQRVEEQYYQLSPISKDPPIVLSQIKFIEGDDSLCKSNPTVDVLQNSRSNHVQQRMYGQGSNTAESTTFKFSISRLPKWAQNKVTGCDMIPTRPKCSSLQQVGLQAFSGSVSNGDSAVMHRELKTPSKDNVQYSVKACCTATKSSEDTDSGASATPIEASRSFALDRRWMTIHTVCLDLLNSPEVWDMKKMQVPQPYTNLSGDRTVENPADNRYIKLLSGGGDFGVDDSYPDPTSMVDNHINRKGTISNDMSTLNNSDSMCNSIRQLDTRNTVACCRKDSCKLSEPTQPDSFKGEGQTTEATNPSTMVEDSEECNTFNLNFSNLSEDVKGQESSSRRKYSSHFVVRDNFNRGPQKQFGTPSGTMSSIGDTVPSISSEDHHYVQISEKSQRTTEQDLNSAQILLSHINSCGDSVGLCTRPEESNSDMNQKTETIISCKQALIRLDSETDKALELFSKLDSLASGVNILTGPEAQFYEEAAEMLPLIAKKVHTIAKLAQSTQNNTCRKSEIDVPSFEPFLGTFAENISQRVVEILKKNSATL